MRSSYLHHSIDEAGVAQVPEASPGLRVCRQTRRGFALSKHNRNHVNATPRPASLAPCRSSQGAPNMTYALRAASTDPAANPPRTTPLLKTSISLIRTRDDHVIFMSLSAGPHLDSDVID